ncbi:MAG: DUF1461 domain-containing protein [Patescibacteria group bacterium]
MNHHLKLSLFIFCLFLSNVVLLCQPFIFLKVYPYLTQVDRFGWSIQEQKQQSAIILTYLNSNQHFEQDSLNEKKVVLSSTEVNHMNDVLKIVKMTKMIFGFAFVFTLFFFVRFVQSHRQNPVRQYQSFLIHGLTFYSSLTIMLCLLIFVAWSSFFTWFHQLLFANGSWLFPLDSTLIRLFPEVFWQRTAVLILLLPLCELLLLFLSSCLIRQKSQLKAMIQ